MIIKLSMGDDQIGITPTDIIPWIMGYGATNGANLMIAPIDGSSTGTLPDVSLRVSTTGGCEQYIVRVGENELSVPESWALPWARGLAAAHGVDLMKSLGDVSSQRDRRSHVMRAMMVCDHLGWMRYVRYEKGNDHGCTGK